MSVETSVKLVFPSEVRLVDLVHSACEKMAELAGFDEGEALNLGLAVREAVINAVLHGNHGDRSLEVSVTFTVDDSRIEARITDQGDGFDPDQTADPTEEDNLLRTSGRGLLLMRAFVDEVVFSHPAQGGTEVTLTKGRVPEGADED